MCIPEEYSDTKIIDISITKVYVDKPIHYSVFFRMSSWLLKEFEEQEDVIFTFICSTEELNTNHPDILPQEFRWKLFDKLYQRQVNTLQLRVQDIVVGPEGYQSLSRAFYRDKHAPIINIIVAYLQEKQQEY
ncbi:MAG: hypothetical protein K2H47_00035 [Muribaculaceae bacterium]|nr:hypothetical protein [Muribaculaceae bacterium]